MTIYTYKCGKKIIAIERKLLIFNIYANLLERWKWLTTIIMICSTKDIYVYIYIFYIYIYIISFIYI